MDDVALDPFWRGRTVLVTGAAGLLGGWLSRHLLTAGAEVVGLDIDWSTGAILAANEPVVRLDGDVRDREVLENAVLEHEPSVVVHLAAQTQVGVANENPVGTFEHNILGTWTALDACRRADSVVSVVVALCTGIVLWKGTALIVAGTMTAGALTVYLAYLSKFSFPVAEAV